jgi:hypothetical protein
MRWSSWGRGTSASFWSRTEGAAPAFWANQPLEPLAGRPHRPFSRPQIINAAFTDATRPASSTPMSITCAARRSPRSFVTGCGRGYRLGAL